MKSFDKKIEEEVKKTLKVPDHIQRVEGNPYLLTRIKARIQQEPESPPDILSRAPVMALCLCLVLINFFVLSNALSSSTTSENNILTEHFFPAVEQDNWYEYLN